MSKLLTLPGIIPSKLNHFLPPRYRASGLENPVRLIIYSLT